MARAYGITGKLLFVSLIFTSRTVRLVSSMAFHDF